jgi:arylformamidase
MSADLDIMRSKRLQIIDISQPISSSTACFPGDVPFSKEITVSYESSNVINLTAIKMSPHVGTHADSPVHVRGDLSEQKETAGQMPLSPFVGPAMVIDLSPHDGAITIADLQAKQPRDQELGERILFRTKRQVRYDVWEDSYAYFTTELIDHLADCGVKLVGIDTPSVDATSSKTLETHHRLLQHDLYWLENLDLSQAQAGTYFLVALPLKLMEAEASPVRAVLLKGGE